MKKETESPTDYLGLDAENQMLYEKSVELKHIVTVQSIIDKVKKAKEEGFRSGISTGYDSLDEYFTVKPCEMTVVTGIPGSGKTTFVDNICVRMAFQSNWKFAVLSAENLPHERHILSLVEKHYREPLERVSSCDLDEALDFLNNHFFFLNPPETDFTISKILQLCEELYFEKKINCLVIDPWNELEHKRPKNQSETEYIGYVLSAVRRFSRLLKIHTFIVAHPTKLQKRDDGTYPVPTPYDISGSANWRNKADNCLSLWWNYKEIGSADIHIQKIRFREVGKLGMVRLGFDTITGVYSDPREKF